MLVNHELSGLVVGLTVTTRPEDVYRAPDGGDGVRGPHDRRDVRRRRACRSTSIIVAGGLTKNRLLMQIYADVLRLPLSVIGSEQGPALGSAIHAAVAAGAYPDVTSGGRGDGPAGAARCTSRSPANADRYDELFAEYTALHDHFGRGGSDVMRRLKRIRREVGRGRGRRDAAAVTSRRRSLGCAPRWPALHAELVRYGLVVWTAGNISARVPGADLLVIKPSGVPYDELSPEQHGRVRPRRQRRRGRSPPVVGHRRVGVHLPPHPGRRRRRPHPLDLRDRVGEPRRGRSRAC